MKNETFSLFATYPELEETIDDLCQGVPWRVTGASTLLYDAQERFYFEITKPKHWRFLGNSGHVIVGLGAIGGSIKPGEAILDCLRREIEEEVDATVTIQSSDKTYILYEEESVVMLSLPARRLPCPFLWTVSKNVYRRHTHPQYPILAIATFVAQLEEAPSLGDLFGLLIVPSDRLREVFTDDKIPFREVKEIPGVSAVVRETLPPGSVLSPVWTGKTLQRLLQRDYLHDMKGAIS
ncbi:MAG: NUDIX domain-containing protein [Anaerolineales bacterium]